MTPFQTEIAPLVESTRKHLEALRAVAAARGASRSLLANIDDVEKTLKWLTKQ